MRVAAVQMNSSDDPVSNLESAAGLIDTAARQKNASVVVLPENFSVMPAREKDRRSFAEAEGNGPVQTFLSEQARRHGVWIVGGTAPVWADDGLRITAACLVFDDGGRRVARYNKIHLFDVQVSDTESYRESDALKAGSANDENIVCVDTPAGRVGLSVCYDLRFPELYRRLADRGAEIVTVPAAFTATTGQAHWETLLRARAIENQCYIAAPGQWGTHASNRKTFGHSMIIDPWGRVLAQRDNGNDVIVADIDLEQLKDVRKRFPSLTHRRFH